MATCCKSCGAPIRYVKTDQGKMMPCNLDGVMILPGEGNGSFITVGGHVIKGKRVGFDTAGAKYGYISHFATCPNAEQHRKRGKA